METAIILVTAYGWPADTLIRDLKVDHAQTECPSVRGCSTTMEAEKRDPGNEVEFGSSSLQRGCNKILVKER